jgi:Fungal trichothecene efflux pump (TRI12)
LTLLITALAGANLYPFLNFWPLEAQVLFGPNPHEIARTIIPFGYAAASGVIFVNWGLSIFHGANRELLVISSCLMTAGVGALAAVNTGNRGLGVGMSVLGGFGLEGIIIPAAVILTIISPDEVIATVAAINLSVRFIGGSVGYAVYFNIFQNKLTEVLPTSVGLAAAQAGLPLGEIPELVMALVAQNTTAISQIPAISPAILLPPESAVKNSYVEGFRKVCLVSIAFGGAGIIASVFLGDIKKYMVGRVAVDIH